MSGSILRLQNGSTRPGSHRLSLVVYCTWMASIAACVALWTLAPTVIFLQSLQKHTLAPTGQDLVFAPGGMPSLFLHAQQRRHIKRLQAVSTADCATQHASAAVHTSTSARAGQAATEQNIMASPPQDNKQQMPFRTTQQQQQQQQQGIIHAPVSLHQQLQQMLGPVDVVYMWVNGSDPVLQRELENFHASTAAAGAAETFEGAPNTDAVRQARFDSSRDELRFSLRSLELYMPWYRKIWLVTNGQVPSWLRLNNPRLTVVPHSSIFPNASHLPTFNSNAIQANLANIPGLGESFVLMDDDLFLTAPWTLSDFIGPDGGQVITGSTLASTTKRFDNMYLSGIAHTAEIFEQRFGAWMRYDPAHAPKLCQVRWLKELQQKMVGEFEATSAAHVRSPNDIIVPAAYQWYVSQYQPGQHSTADDALAGFASINDYVARPYWTAAINDFQERVAAGDAAAIAADMRQAPDEQQFLTATAFEAQQALTGSPGPHISARIVSHLQALIGDFSAPRAKSVVLNDDTDDSMAHVRALINPVVRHFLQARYAVRSSFELPSDTNNGCSGRLPPTHFGQLPTAEQVAATCPQPQPAAMPWQGAQAANMAARAAAAHWQPAVVPNRLAPGRTRGDKFTAA